MFQKHQFTCPDVIYMRNRQKKINKATIVVNLIFFGGMIAAAKIAERKEIKELQQDAETLANQE